MTRQGPDDPMLKSHQGKGIYFFSKRPLQLDRWEGSQKTQLVSYIKDVYSKIRSKTTCFGLIWPSSGFVLSFPLRFRYINCDVEISHPIIIVVCLCIGGYYITLIYIYRVPRRNVKYFGGVFLMLNYSDITQNTYIQS